MKYLNKKAFTLIELLVVVLIIGILAAIAVPQYQTAVMKSRFATMKDIVRSVIDAEERYYLANNDYTTNFNDLDISYPLVDNSTINFNGGYCQISWWSSPSDGIICILTTSPYIAIEYHFRYPEIKSCRVFTEEQKTTAQDKVCQQETGKNAPDATGNSSRYYYYF